MPSSFESLPENVFGLLIKHLDAYDLARLSTASKKTRQSAKEGAALLVSYMKRVMFPNTVADTLSNPIDLYRQMTTDSILLIGGSFSEQSVSKISCSRPNHHLQPMAEIPTPRDGFSAVESCGFLYLFSGEGDRVSKSVEVYDILANKWRAPVALPRQIRQSQGVVIEDQMVWIGGEDVQTSLPLDTLLVAEPAGEDEVKCGSGFLHWMGCTARLQHPRTHHAAVVYRNKLWVAGGIEHDRFMSNSVETLSLVDESGNFLGLPTRALDAPAYTNDSFEGNEFVEAAPMNSKRRNFNLLVADDKLYAVGGDDEGTIEMYDEKSSSWLVITRLPEFRRHFSSCVAGITMTNPADMVTQSPGADVAVSSSYLNCECIYIFGGQDVRRNGLRSVDIYNVTTGQWLSAAHTDDRAQSTFPKRKSFSTLSDASSSTNSSASAVTESTQDAGGAARGDRWELPKEEYFSGFVFGRAVSLKYSTVACCAAF